MSIFWLITCTKLTECLWTSQAYSSIHNYSVKNNTCIVCVLSPRVLSILYLYMGHPFVTFQALRGATHIY